MGGGIGVGEEDGDIARGFGVDRVRWGRKIEDEGGGGKGTRAMRVFTHVLRRMGVHRWGG